jgi:hypothetical protein
MRTQPAAGPVALMHSSCVAYARRMRVVRSLLQAAVPGTDDPGAGPAKLSPIKQRYVEELNEDVEGMAELLRSLGITVHPAVDAEGGGRGPDPGRGRPRSCHR